MWREVVAEEKKNGKQKMLRAMQEESKFNKKKGVTILQIELAWREMKLSSSFWEGKRKRNQQRTNKDNIARSHHKVKKH